MQWISDTDSSVCSEDDSFIAIVLAREHTNRKRTLNSIHEESAGPSTHYEDTSAKPNQDAQRHVVMHLEEEEEEERERGGGMGERNDDDARHEHRECEPGRGKRKRTSAWYAI